MTLWRKKCRQRSVARLVFSRQNALVSITPRARPYLTHATPRHQTDPAQRVWVLNDKAKQQCGLRTGGASWIVTSS